MNILTEAASHAIHDGLLTPPSGLTIPEFLDRLNNMTDEDWTWAIIAGSKTRSVDGIVVSALDQFRSELVQTRQEYNNTSQGVNVIGAKIFDGMNNVLASIRSEISRLSDSMSEVKLSYSPVEITIQKVREEIKLLDSLIRPLFQTPDESTNHGVIEWRNLWSFWQFVPGTIKPRVLLTLWEFINWGIAFYTAYLIGKLDYGILASVGGLVIVMITLFIKHELLFRWWGRVVCKLNEQENDSSPGFISTLERWKGPVF